MHAQLSTRLYRQLQADAGMSLANFDVLVTLTDQPEPRMRFAALAETLQWDKTVPHTT